MKGWNLLAEVLGFLSGCLLLWPAVTQNATLRRVWMTRRQFESSSTKLARQMRESNSLKTAGQLAWSLTDQWLLTLGALLLVASFAIKLFVIWASP